MAAYYYLSRVKLHGKKEANKLNNFPSKFEKKF